MNPALQFRLITVGIGGFMVGLVAGNWLDLSGYITILLCALVVAATVRRNKVAVACLWTAVVFLCIGAWRMEAYQASESQITRTIGSFRAVRGELKEDPGTAVSGKDSFVLSNITIEDFGAEGTILVHTDLPEPARRGDVVVLEGLVGEGFGTYAASMFDARVVSVEMLSKKNLALQFRDWFSKNVRETMQDTSASLGLGFLVGEKSSLPEDVAINLRLTGLTHIIVASGFNLTILILAVRYLLHRISRFTATAGGIGMALVFVAISGVGPSMQRASIVTILALIAWHFGRKFRPLFLIFLVAAVTAGINPGYLKGDVGWYLSFLSFFGVLCIAPLIERFFFSDKTKKNLFRSALIESMSAVIVTAPYVGYVFGQVSILAVFANMFVVPFIPLVMLLTFSAGLLYEVVPIIGSLIGAVADVIISAILYIVDFFADIDPGVELPEYSAWWLLLWYVPVLGVYLYVQNSPYFGAPKVQKDIDE